MRFLLLLLFSFPLLAHASIPYTNNLTGPDVYYASIKEACEQMIPAAESYFASSGTSGLTIKLTYSHGACVYSFKRSDGYSGKSPSSISLGKVASAIAAEQCSQGKSETITFPLGRQFTDGRPFQDFGFPFPIRMCVDGCDADIDPASLSGNGPPPFALPDPDDSFAEITYSELAYITSGTTCNTSSNPPSPVIPPPTQGGGDTGGGDTGGGDTGGGDTGGGDTGGGDNGGGDNGGGTNPGGGDTGGGDTGGGTNPGGGDTGGGTNPGDGTGDNGSSPGTDAAGILCDQILTCTGDAVGCAQLHLAKMQKCSQEQGVYYPAQRDAINTFLSNPEFKQEEDEEINVGDLFNSGTRFLPSSGCPKPRTIALGGGGGRTFELTFEPLCQFATDLGYLIVAASGVFFAIYIGRAAGGE